MSTFKLDKTLSLRTPLFKGRELNTIKADILSIVALNFDKLDFN